MALTISVCWRTSECRCPSPEVRVCAIWGENRSGGVLRGEWGRGSDASPEVPADFVDISDAMSAKQGEKSASLEFGGGFVGNLSEEVVRVLNDHGD